MARVSIEDCQKKLANRFALTITAAHRARQLLDGKSDPLIKANNKEAVIALREIAEGLITMDRPMDEIIGLKPKQKSSDDASKTASKKDADDNKNFNSIKSDEDAIQRT